MFIVHPETTWWQPRPNAVIDARDIAGLGTVVMESTTGTKNYMLNVYLSGASTDDKREFSYTSLDDLNEALKPLGLEWQDA